MLKWYPSELHTHTFHSDGKHTLLQLANAAKAEGLKVLALTDHNTVSGHTEIENVHKETGMLIIKGLEHTTFYGHVLNLGLDKYIDWRKLNKDNLKDLIDEAHTCGAVVGIAHPFRVGGPLCTGCFMEFELDWNDIDYLEVWSREFPPVDAYENLPAFKFWNDMLNKGYRIVVTSGRDWHASERRSKTPVCRTFLGFSKEPNLENISQLAVDAIKNGMVSLSMVGCVMGDIAETDGKGKGKILASIDNLKMEEYWQKHMVSDLKLKLNSDLGILGEKAVQEKEDVYFLVNKKTKWVRPELHGVIDGHETILGFRNPLYLSD